MRNVVGLCVTDAGVSVLLVVYRGRVVFEGVWSLGFEKWDNGRIICYNNTTIVIITKKYFLCALFNKTKSSKAQFKIKNWIHYDIMVTHSILS